MNNEILKIILVEDNPSDVRFIKELLKEDIHLEITNVDLLSKAIKLLNKEEYDLILLDLNLPDSKGINTFKEFSSKIKNIPIIILTVVDNKEIAIEAIKLGAQDYKIKGSFDYISFRNSINYAIERKKLLTESKIFNIFFNNSPIGMIITDSEQNIIDANFAFSKIIGYSLDELKKLTFKDFTHPDDLAESIKLVKELALGKINNFTLEKKYIRKDGKIIYGNAKFNSVKDDKGKIIYNVVSIEDITESKKNIDKILKNHDEMFALFDSIDDVIYVTDMETYEIIYVNNYAKKILGKKLIGGICYKEFQGLKKPCSFCTNKKIKSLKGKPYRWQHYNQNLDRHYDLIDKVIDWPDGRKVRFELAKDGNECIKKLSKNIELIILDIMMPGPSTKKIIKSIKKKSPKAMVIYLTAIEAFNLTNEQKEKKYSPLFDPPVVGYLQKPITKEQLIEKINDALSMKKIIEK